MVIASASAFWSLGTQARSRTHPRSSSTVANSHKNASSGNLVVIMRFKTNLFPWLSVVSPAEIVPLTQSLLSRPPRNRTVLSSDPRSSSAAITRKGSPRL